LSKGVSVILAHADRYPKENIEKLVSLGAKIQLNADSLLGLFKKKYLYDWLERGLVCALGSDIHGAEKKYYKNFTKAVREISEYAENIKIESDKIFEASFSE
jgi:tyrosine-protein phosphatase YwqE